jgi:hypothetical protein
MRTPWSDDTSKQRDYLYLLPAMPHPFEIIKLPAKAFLPGERP